MYCFMLQGGVRITCPLRAGGGGGSVNAKLPCSYTAHHDKHVVLKPDLQCLHVAAIPIPVDQDEGWQPCRKSRVHILTEEQPLSPH
jgi:hypothetical protein